MRIYDAATAALLGARKGIITQRLVWIAARNRATGAVEGLGLCTGLDDITLTIEGEARTYLAVGALLQSEPITAGSGLVVRVHQLQLAAVAPEVEELVRGYDTRFAAVEIHRVLFDPEPTATMQAPPAPLLGGIEPTLYLNFADRSYGTRALEAQDFLLDGVEPALVADFANRTFGVSPPEASGAPLPVQMVGPPHRVFRGMVNALEFERAAPGEAPAVRVECVSETRVLTRSLPTKKSDESHKARGGDRFRRFGDVSGTVPVYWGELRVSAPAPAPEPEGLFNSGFLFGLFGGSTQ